MNAVNDFLSAAMDYFILKRSLTSAKVSKWILYNVILIYIHIKMYMGIN